jgi:N-acetylmuramoyl-L-alanine amidase
MNRAFFLFILFLSFPSFATVILIDPGHGGEELGAIAEVSKKKIYEKDLSLRLGSKIKDYLQGSATVYLTRSLDRAVTLKERAELAEKLKADLFISVHFNSSPNQKSHGFETYYLDNSKDAAVRKVETQENVGLKGEELEINHILTDLVIQQTVKFSKPLAQNIQQYLSIEMKEHKMVNRGVKPGLFYVLALSKRPGVLLEVGFMSNPQEVKTITKDKFLDDYARAVAQGVKKHLKI